MASYATEVAEKPVAVDLMSSAMVNDIKWTYKWHFIILFAFLHAGALYGTYLIHASKWQTVVFAVLTIWAGMLGITAGAHRLWTHKSYKAKWPLQLILVIFQVIASQFSIMDWVRIHRTHHKYSDTDADPCNASRGFFFSHMGWLFVNEHPEYVRKSKEVDLSDLYRDPMLRFQDKYYWVLVGIFSIMIPTAIPVYFWNESWTNSLCVAMMFRFVVTLNATCCINSVAHMLGDRPYDAAIKPREIFICSVITLGEGSHNYHHTFPWDYKTSELFQSFNTTTNFIDLFAKIGWAYDMKTVSEEVIEKRVKRTGDGSHQLWGWGDRDLSEEEKKAAIIINSKYDRVQI